MRGLEPRSIVVFSRDEKKQYEMRLEFPEVRYVLGDIRDYTSIAGALSNIDVVFHAAALKQVPNCEEWPMEAVKTNVLGADNLCRAAVERRVGTVIALSTDKAVEPVNAMGISKALMEKTVLAADRRSESTVFACVRYGNVMGSRGSVIPLFHTQIRREVPLTITVPDMTRFMLTLNDAVRLVFFAMENAKGGEIFVRKAPACTIEFLADVMMRKYQARVTAKRVVGMRVGEKLHETLISEFEMLRANDEGEFYVIPSDADGRNIAGPLVPEAYRSSNTRRITDPEELGALLDEAESFAVAPL